MGRALAILPRDHLQRATPHGGLALRLGEELDGAARRAREVGFRVQRQVPPGPREASGRRSPAEVLGVLREARLLPADLDRVFFAERFARVLDAFGYVVWRRWRVYGEESLAGREAALWLRERP